jgi:hypothetical protein
MGKVKIGSGSSKSEAKPKEESLGEKIVAGLSEAAVADMLNKHTEELMIRLQKLEKHTPLAPILPPPCQCKCEKAKPDHRLRRYVTRSRKLTKKDLALLDEKIYASDIKRVKLEAKSEQHQIRLDNQESEMAKIQHHLELIEQELKVKPLNVKTEKVIERFDHRLVLFNLILLFLNALFLMHILSN